MPNIKSAKKRMRQDKRKREYNKGLKTGAKNIARKLKNLINEGKIEEARKLLPQAMSTIDKTVSKGAWTKNKAAREKSRLMKKLGQPPIP